MSPIEEELQRDKFLKDRGPEVFSYDDALSASPDTEIPDDIGGPSKAAQMAIDKASLEPPQDTPPSPAAAPSFPVNEDSGVVKRDTAADSITNDDDESPASTSEEPLSAPPMVDAEAPAANNEYIEALRKLATAPDSVSGPSGASAMAIEQARERDKQNNLTDVMRRALFSATTRSGQSPYGNESHAEEQAAMAQQQRSDALKQRGDEKRSAAQLALAKAMTPKQEDPTLALQRQAMAEHYRALSETQRADAERKAREEERRAKEAEARGEGSAVEQQRKEMELQEKKREFDATLAAKEKARAAGSASAKEKAAAKVTENEAANTITFDGVTLHGGPGIDKEERHKAKEKLANIGQALSGLDKIQADIQEYVSHPGLNTKNKLGTDVALVAGAISQGAGSGVLNGAEFERYAAALGANPTDATALISIFKGLEDDPNAAKGMLSRVQAARKIMRDGALNHVGVYGFRSEDGERKAPHQKPTEGESSGPVKMKFPDGSTHTVSPEDLDMARKKGGIEVGG